MPVRVAGLPASPGERKEGRRNLPAQLHLLRELLARPEGQPGTLLIAERSTVHLAPAAFTNDGRVSRRPPGRFAHGRADRAGAGVGGGGGA
jgi:hypothetical protein